MPDPLRESIEIVPLLPFDVKSDCDADVEAVWPIATSRDLSRLLSLLTGTELSVPNEDDDAFRKELIHSIAGGIAEHGWKISFEQLNEILLLFGARRISRGFFELFFRRGVQGVASADGEAPPSISIADLRSGVARFRVFALLHFGNFRFAFARLSQPPPQLSQDTPEHVCQLLGVWADSPQSRVSRLKSRPRPLLPIDSDGDLVARCDSWHLGYLSVEQAYREFARVVVLDALSQGVALEEKISALSGLNPEEARGAVEAQVRRQWSEVDSGELERHSQELPRLVHDAQGLLEGIEKSTAKGRRNTLRYLTWDYLDVYVATSMRERWEFEDTFDAAQLILSPLAANLGVRYFDPTQSFEQSPVDKGLLESLMLKRARCTLYLAQETDTLGKDSELAATLAQGKPVVVFIPNYLDDRLEILRDRIEARPLRYFRKRLLEVLADGILRKEASRISAQLARLENPATAPEGLEDRVRPCAFRLVQERPTLELLDPVGEEVAFSELGGKRALANLLAAIEAVFLDRRAAMYLRFHPLALQVHLENGVANGVLVARTEDEARLLLEALLTNEMRFRVKPAVDEIAGRRIGTALHEAVTNNSSKFRVVTDHALLTNSFWSFYLRSSA